MKKFLTNLVALALVMCLAFSTTACGKRIIEDIDETKTQLQIASYSGGGGYKWLYDKETLNDAKTRFEEKYKDVSFEEGKVGVQVMVDHNKQYGVSKVKESLTTGGFDVYFAPGDYYDFAEGGLLLDITDIVQAENPNDNKTIESKMSAETQAKWKVDGKYYGVPYYDFVSGVSYDADLFNNNKLYFSDELDDDDTDYPGTNAFVETKDATNKSCGPDGVFGTYDDGLPSTYQEFYKLMERMVLGEGGEVIIPFAFTGEYAHYTNLLMSALEANFVGANGMRTTVDFNSHGEEVEIVTGFKDNKPTTEKVVLTEDNAYRLKSSLGLYYASEFCEKVFTHREYYDSIASAKSGTNIDAQERFLRGGIDGGTTPPIGMIIEGSYWYNESISEGAMEKANKYGKKDVRFMPMPHQYAGTVTPREEGEEPMSQVLIISSANALIAADTQQPELAKLFLQFCYSDEELVKAELSNNGISRDLIYDTTSIQKDLSDYALSLNQMKAQAVECNTLFSNMSQNPIAKKQTTYWNREQTGSYWSSTVGGSKYASVCGPFQNRRATAITYFQGLELKKEVYDGWRPKK